jgi:hypothetical protein
MKQIGIFASAIALGAVVICSGPALALGGGHGGGTVTLGPVGGMRGGMTSGVNSSMNSGMNSSGNAGFEGRSAGVNSGESNLLRGNGTGCIPSTSCSH